MTKATLKHDKDTNVAFIDLCEAKAPGAVRVLDVSDDLGLKCQVLARFDAETGTLLGLMIEDYPAFRRELRIKYIALAVDRLIDLIVSKVRDSAAVSARAHNQLIPC